MDEAARVYEVLVGGGVALVPTVAGYGLVATRASAVERIYALKGRPATKPCITVATAAIHDELVVPSEPRVRGWIEETAAWTPIAVIGWVRPWSRLLARVEPYVLTQCTSAGTVATFHSAGALVTAVAELGFVDGTWVVGSSANRSGTGNSWSLDEVPAEMRTGADVVIDTGPIVPPDGQRAATTLLDLTRDRFVREGLNFAAIERSWRALRPLAAEARV